MGRKRKTWCEKHQSPRKYYKKFKKSVCNKCTSERVAQRRREVNAILIGEHGGKCVLCGYSKNLGALQFHHRDPEEKEFPISSGNTLSLERLRVEAKKCDLVCGNCHTEIEYPHLNIGTWSKGKTLGC